jgi:hypothetical protein
VNWEAISAIGQIVGALAVVVSLIYLIREIRSNARSARVASLHDINRWLGELVEHPHLGELYYRGIQDFASLEGADIARFGALMGQLFFIHQELYYQQLDGHLDPRLWDGLDAAMREINAYPGVQAWWRSRTDFFGKEFRKQVNQLQRDRAKTAARLRQLAKNVPARGRCTQREES